MSGRPAHELIKEARMRVQERRRYSRRAVSVPVILGIVALLVIGCGSESSAPASPPLPDQRWKSRAS